MRYALVSRPARTVLMPSVKCRSGVDAEAVRAASRSPPDAVAYPGKPADHADYMAGLRRKLREPGLMAEFIKTGKATPTDAEAQLPGITCPALVIVGTLDPDFADPEAEGEAVVAAMPAGLGTVAMIDGAGHYPHARNPDEVAALVIGFLKEHVGS